MSSHDHVSDVMELRRREIDKFHRFVHDIPFFDGGLQQYVPEGYKPETIEENARRLESAVKVGEGVVASSAIVELLEGADVQQTSFSRINARGGQNSRRGVFFGKIGLNDTSVDVAIKVYPDEDGHIDRTVSHEMVKVKTDAVFVKELDLRENDVFLLNMIKH